MMDYLIFISNFVKVIDKCDAPFPGGPVDHR